MNKQLVATVSLIVIIVGSGFLLYESSNRSISIPVVNMILPEKACSQPLRYSIGQLDEEFDVTRSEFKEAIVFAASVWEEKTTRDLFVYDSSANFEIELIFDKRQQRTIQQNQIESQLQELQEEHQERATRYENIKNVYDRQLQSFQKKQAAYEEQLAEYNRRVAYWNERGGAPEEEYEKLQSKKAELDQQKKQLEQEREQVNALVRQLNQIAAGTNEISQQYQQTADTYQKRYGAPRQFNQGEYHGDDIQIYQFSDTQDLRLVLVHELGHALGIGHVQDSEAIMHSLMQDQNMTDISLTDADIHVLQEACNLSESELRL